MGLRLSFVWGEGSVEWKWLFLRTHHLFLACHNPLRARTLAENTLRSKRKFFISPQPNDDDSDGVGDGSGDSGGG